MPPANGGASKPDIAFLEERWLHKPWRGLLGLAIWVAPELDEV